MFRYRDHIDFQRLCIFGRHGALQILLLLLLLLLLEFCKNNLR